jgi:hypothetical protein
LQPFGSGVGDAQVDINECCEPALVLELTKAQDLTGERLRVVDLSSCAAGDLDVAAVSLW